ncbi:MAG: hypothetical protein HY773_00765, partial [Candidatus Terrybacteria bacterium]|nr:hypothetical protein [Candidatus Terrybacteria bacterium]
GGTGQNFSASSGLINLYSGTASAIATSSLGLLTTDVAEGTNQYWTNTRFDARLAATTSLPTLTTLTGLTNASTTLLSVGSGGTTISKHLSVTQANVVSASIATVTCGNYGTITVTGAAVGDTVIASPTAVASGIETLNLGWSAAVTAANTVTIRACNPTAGAIDALDTQTWRADVWQH